ncbi:MAG: flagellar basal body rod protein FlgB [Alphaproteobacteria bacterium]|nr:flagellar basal body rod protein FlgB [Alphaproteobacteria bacterium]
MDLKNLTVFNMANKNMQYLAARQQVIAENIANASTPGYLARDIQKPSFEEEMSSAAVAGLKLNLTNPKHLQGVPNKNQGSYLVYTPQPSEALTIDGNGVVLEQQMNEASKISSEYKRMITIFNKYRSLMQISSTKISA